MQRTLWISIERQKTGIRCDIPLLDIPLQIMEKYRPERKDGKIFNMVSISSVEVNLNKVAKLCGIEKRITYHQSRHNFGTLITLSRGVPLETASQMMGHKCFRTTQIYARLTRQKINDDMKKISGSTARNYQLPNDAVKKDNNTTPNKSSSHEKRTYHHIKRYRIRTGIRQGLDVGIRNSSDF